MAGELSENTIGNQVLERLQLLPQSLQSQVLDYLDFLLSTYPNSEQNQPIQPGTLTGLRGILGDIELQDECIEDEYVNYLLEKYK